MWTVAVMAMLIVGCASQAFGAPLRVPAPGEEDVARSFARALQRADVVVGVYEVPDGSAPVILPSGKVLESMPGYLDKAIHGNIVKVKVVRMIKGQTNSFVFIKKIIQLVEGKRSSLFWGLPGSRWLLALEKVAAEKRPGGEWRDVDDAAALIDANTFQLAEDDVSGACLAWPKGKGLKKPSDILEVNDAAVEDLGTVRGVHDAQVRKKEWSSGEIGGLRRSLKTDFGRAVLDELSRSVGVDLKKSQ